MESSYVTLATSTAKNNNFAQYLAVSPLASVLLVSILNFSNLFDFQKLTLIPG
jgi:hypothetical protein